MIDGLSDAEMYGAGVLLVEVGHERLSQAGWHDSLKVQDFSGRLIECPS